MVAIHANSTLINWYLKIWPTSSVFTKHVYKSGRYQQYFEVIGPCKQLKFIMNSNDLGFSGQVY